MITDSNGSINVPVACRTCPLVQAMTQVLDERRSLMEFLEAQARDEIMRAAGDDPSAPPERGS